MNFIWYIDGTIVGAYLLVTMIAGLMVRKYVGNVEDFLVAGREMDVYLGIASLAAAEFGVVTCMYAAQYGYKHGFAGATPGLLWFFSLMFVGLTGFCIKPMRDAGVITIPEFFEKRFGLGIRWAAGVVIVLGGLLNMGVFLRTGGEFLVFASGLNEDYLEITMTALLIAVAIYTILGGMLSVLVTDYLQFIVMSAGLLVVTVLILMNVGWGQMVTTVNTHYGEGGFNPFVNPELGAPWVLFNAFVCLSATLTWQTNVQRVMAAKDSDTGRRIYTRTSFFFICRFLIPAIWGIAALTMFGWAPLSRLQPEELSQIPPAVEAKIAASKAPNPITVADNDDAFAKLTPGQKAYTLTKEEVKSIPSPVRDKLNTFSLNEMPRFLSSAVPVGLVGLLIAAMLAADMSTDSTYMLTWSSVIYNDILAPFRRRQSWSQRFGLLVNRSIVAAIGIFLLLYGLWYPAKGALWDYLTVTASIYLASMSVLLIACCYWNRANNWGAAAAIVVGAVIPIAYLVMEQLPATQEFAQEVGPYWSGIATYVLAGAAMIVGSLLKPLFVRQSTIGGLV